MRTVLLASFLLVLSAKAFALGESLSGMKRPSEMRFTENKGQWDDQILFRASVPNGHVILEKNGFYFILYSGEELSHLHHPSQTKEATVKGHAFKETFVGANPQAVLKGRSAYSDYANFYIGKDPAHWASEVKIYPQIKYEQLYHGIDLLFQTKGADLLKYDLIVHPGANASQIKWRYEGVEQLKLRKGELLIRTSVGDIVEQKPFAYQEINGEKKEVRCSFSLDSTEVSFSMPEGYDARYDLIIDPTIEFSTYTGSTYDNWGYTATYDFDGNMYVGGYVNGFGQLAPGYPTTLGAFQATWQGGSGSNMGNGNGIGFACDMGISKFSSNGAALLYSTYLGGTDNETPNSLVVDAQNNLIIYGVSYSTDFPVSPNAYNPIYGGGGDIVVTKFNAAGTALIGSTFIGGAGIDGMNGDPGEFTSGNLKRNYGDQNRGEVNVDKADNIYVASCTSSPNFPVTAGAFQSTLGGVQDGCAFKLNDNCSQLLWSSFIGGISDDACYSLDIGPNGTLYIAGGTMSNNFPTTVGSLNATYQGGTYDGFVAHINNTGTQLLASSYIGTVGNDQVYFVKLDAHGDVYFVGQTTGQYPVLNAPYSNPNSGQFIAKVNSSLSMVNYSTVFGNGDGQPNISPTAFLVDTCENVYVAGWGAGIGSIFSSYNPTFQNIMTNMPLSADAMQTTTDGVDFYFFVLGKNAQNILYGSYFGGAGNGFSTGIEHVDGGTSRFDSRGVIYEAICAGCGGNSITPTTPGSWSPTNRSSNCNELGLKIAFNLAGTSVSIQASPRATGCVPLTVQFQSTVTNTQSIIWHFGDGTTSTLGNPAHTFTDTGTYYVMLIGFDPNSCNITDTARLIVWVRNDFLSADFSPSVTITCDSNHIALSSSGFSTTKYSWNMGDNTNYTTQSVQHKYTSPGNYNIRLIITDSTKCNLTDTFIRQVTILPTVRADFAPTSSRGCIPHTASFNVPFVSTASYQWFFGDGTTGNTSSVSHTYTTVDTFHVMLLVKDASSCNKTDTAYGLVITIDSSTNADFHFIRTFINCDTVLITAWSDYQGEDSEVWDFGDGTQIANTDTVSHIYSVAGTYTLTHFLTDSKMACHPIDTSKITTSLNPLNISISIQDTSGCSPLNLRFAGTSGLPTTQYFWHFGDGDSASGNNVVHLYQGSGTFQVKLVAVDSNTCTGIDSVFALVTLANDSVIADFKLDILNDCDSNLVVDLTNQSTNAAQYFWNFGDGTSSSAMDENHTYHSPGSYAITLLVVDNNRCHPIDSMTKTVRLLPNSNAEFNALNVCEEYAVQFENLSNPNARFIWNFGDAHTSTSFAPAHYYKPSGVYTVHLIIIDSASCNVRDTAIHNVEVYPQPSAGFLIANDTFKFETPIQLRNNSIDYDHLLWDMGDGTLLEDETDPLYTYQKPGWFSICLMASNDVCIDTQCRNVYISYSGIIGVPNAFSPNGDHINDFVRVEGRGIVEMTFRIFNRWGEKVFETKDQHLGWNGVYKGALQEMDTYTYTLNATLVDGQFVTMKGNITLLR
ncbi:MAG: PKD domain-containing protein [Bacteroidetes bacterium]|nr:PKD domain-containing protein [Bacteroidota bacterium]